ncbi:MAG TPA: methyltransferase domain-containing protein [Candidatus Polarisedimenticolia bacterium]|nr:methyltransferase domain-containing protein [Candidatus Polarisedimenticolia bacterium]
MSSLDHIYRARFDDRRRAQKAAIWRVLARYLQRYIATDKPALDVACDSGDFIRNVEASERWATDVRDVSAGLPPDVRFVQADGLELASHLPAGHFGTVLISNYLEHLPNGEAVIEQLRVVRALLAVDGQVVIVQPNIRLVGGRYWDFVDHHVALTERSLEEAANAAGLRTTKLVTRFLPYTTSSRVPRHPLLVRLYLAIPLAWWLLGKQTLYVGRRA